MKPVIKLVLISAVIIGLCPVPGQAKESHHDENVIHEVHEHESQVTEDVKGAVEKKKKSKRRKHSAGHHHPGRPENMVMNFNKKR